MKTEKTPPKIHLISSKLLSSFFTGSPSGKAQQARNLVSEADQGRVIIEILPMILPKVIFELERYLEKRQEARTRKLQSEIKDVLLDFLQSKGIRVRDEEAIFRGLQHYPDDVRNFERACLQAYSEIEDKSVAR